jgi:TonB family protein
VKPAKLACVLVLNLPLRTLAASTEPTQNVRLRNEIAIPNGIVSPPQLLDHPNAAYTFEADQLGIEGNVIVQAEFDANGNFRVLHIVRGLGFGLDESALDALQHWRFLPATQNGRRVSVIAEIEIPFKLPDHRRRVLQEVEQRRNHLRESLGDMRSMLEQHRHLQQTSPGRSPNQN